MTSRQRDLAFGFVALLGAALLAYRLTCPRDWLESSYRARAGVFPTIEAGEAGAVKKLSRQLRCCPRAREYSIEFEVSGVASGRQTLVYFCPEQGPGHLGFEVDRFSGIVPPVRLATPEDIHRLAATGTPLRELPLVAR